MKAFTQAQICQHFNISPRLFSMALKVRRLGCPEVVKAIEVGDMSINLALQICRTHHEGQRLILAELPGMTKRKRTEFVRLVLAFAEAEAA